MDFKIEKTKVYVNNEEIRGWKRFAILFLAYSMLPIVIFIILSIVLAIIGAALSLIIPICIGGLLLIIINFLLNALLK